MQGRTWQAARRPPGCPAHRDGVGAEQRLAGAVGCNILGRLRQNDADQTALSQPPCPEPAAVLQWCCNVTLQSAEWQGPAQG